MPENESATGGNVTGGASGSETVSETGGRARPPRALFLGEIFPAQLDKDGNLTEPEDGRGPGPPHLISVVYAYDKDTEGAARELHAHVDEILGQPYFKAYIYPATELNRDRFSAGVVGGGGGEGRAVLGGAPGNIIYLGQFSTILPDNDDSGDGAAPASGGAPPTG